MNIVSIADEAANRQTPPSRPFFGGIFNRSQPVPELQQQQLQEEADDDDDDDDDDEEDDDE